MISLSTFAALVFTVACIARTVTQEEIFKEFRLTCTDRSQNCQKLVYRKFFYLFTCEYCFSHWVALSVLLATRQRVAFDDWRGNVIALFSIVWSANLVMGCFDLLKVKTKYYRAMARQTEFDTDVSAIERRTYLRKAS